MRLLPRSLFGRMFALSLLATAAALAISGLAIGGVLERFVTGGVDARLRDRLLALQSTVRADGSLDRAQLTRIAARIAPDEPWRIAVAGELVGTAGDVVVADRPHPRGPRPPGRDQRPRAAPDRDGEPFDGRLGSDQRVHGVAATMATRAGDAELFVAVPRATIDRPVLAALAPLAASLAILGLALGGAALLQLRLGLRPLRTLTTAVEEIRHGRSARVREDVPDELVPLARELNALAAESAQSLAGARASAANLAHALKTPIATLGLHLAGDPVAQGQLDRIDATLRHHLGRARAVATDRRAATPLAAVMTDLATTITALHVGRVTIRVDAPGELVAAVDTQDLTEMAGNLIDNAARHASASVLVAARSVDGHLLLTVCDDGPGIPAADRTRATAAGARLDERGDGHGFGLAITRELAELYGGRLTLDTAPGGGLIASVSLPSAHGSSITPPSLR